NLGAGYAVSLVKNGVRLDGIDAGPVRAPLTEPTPEHLAQLERVIAAGREVLAEHKVAGGGVRARAGATESTESTESAESAESGPVITGIDITPVAIADPPLLNASGVHEPFQLRSIIQVRTDAGITGISEAYGDDATLTQLRQAAATLIGLDIFHLNELTRRVTNALA